MSSGGICKDCLHFSPVGSRCTHNLPEALWKRAVVAPGRGLGGPLFDIIDNGIVIDDPGACGYDCDLFERREG